MKLTKLLSFLLVLALTINWAEAQVTNSKTKGFSYQAVARTADGNLIADQDVGMRATILDANGTAVYSETHNVNTTQYGLVNLTIGQGTTVSGSFDHINWAEGGQMLRIEMDVTGGNDYAEIGTTEILAVPVAEFARSAERLTGDMPTSSQWHDGTGIPDNANGNNGDYYIDLASGDIYKMIDGVWEHRGTLPGSATTGDSKGLDDWLLIGNAGTDGGVSDFVGTTDAVDLVFKTGGGEHMRIDHSAGQVLVNTPSAGFSSTSDLVVGPGGSSSSRIELTGAAGGGNSLIDYGEFSGFNIYYWDFASGSYNASISVKNNLRMGINTRLPGYDLHLIGKFKSDGITESSDIRWKKNIKPLESSLEKVLALNGVNYEWRTGEKGFENMKWDKRTHVGFIAQQVEEVIPNVVDTDDEGFKSLQYSHLVPVLVEAIKEQQAIIDQQRNQISQNNVDLDEMKANVEALVKAVKDAGIEVDVEKATVKQ